MYVRIYTSVYTYIHICILFAEQRAWPRADQIGIRQAHHAQSSCQGPCRASFADGWSACREPRHLFDLKAAGSMQQVHQHRHVCRNVFRDRHQGWQRQALLGVLVVLQSAQGVNRGQTGATKMRHSGFFVPGSSGCVYVPQIYSTETTKQTGLGLTSLEHVALESERS